MVFARWMRPFYAMLYVNVSLEKIILKRRYAKTNVKILLLIRSDSILKGEKL